jgi:site-specific recombinase XerC
MLQELASCLSVKNPKVVAPGRRSRRLRGHELPADLRDVESHPTAPRSLNHSLSNHISASPTSTRAMASDDGEDDLATEVLGNGLGFQKFCSVY